jgi:hypothetical protein
MGADSMTIVRTEAETKQYSNADKVFEIHGLPMVVMTYGVGAVGRRSIGSLVQEWTEQRPSFEKGDHTVEQIAQDLGNFVFDQHRHFVDQERAKAEARQEEALLGNTQGGETAEVSPFNPQDYMTGLVFGGYQPKSRFPWLYAWEQPARSGIPEGLRLQRTHEGAAGEDGPEPGVDYWGDTIALDRLYRGADSNFIQQLEGIVGDRDALHNIALDQCWPIIFEGMPLQDAADLVRLMLEVGSGFERFKPGSPQIGGELDIAVLTQARTHWVSRKPMSSALAILSRREPNGDPRKGQS